MSRSRARVVSIVAAVALAAAVFVPTVTFEFTNWDDPDYVIANPVLVSGKLWQLLGPSTTTADAWTPVTMLSFALERAFFGLKPGAFHATNVLLHAACAGLVVVLLLGLGLSPGAAFLGAALFSIHPLQVESVAWVSGRKNLLSTLLLLTALLSFRRGDRTATVSGTLLGALAILAKPTAIVVAPLAFLDRVRAGTAWRRAAIETIPLMLAALAAGMLVMHQQGPARAAIGAEPTSVRLLTMAGVLGDYAVRLVSPSDLSAYYPVDPIRGGDPIAWLLLGGITLGCLVLGWLVWRSPGARFLALWIPVAGFPHANVIAGPFWIADRYAYLPLIGAAGLLGFGASRLLERGRAGTRIAVAVAATLAVAALATRTVERSAVWRSSHSLWEDTLRKAPRFTDGYINLGAALALEGDHAGAAVAYSRALELRPGEAKVLASLANAYSELGRSDEANELYAQALLSDPGSFAAHYNRGLLLQGEGRVEEAVEHYLRALDAEPGSWIGWNNLGNAYQSLGRLEEALGCYANALDANPGYAPALSNSGDAYRRSHRREEARRAYERALVFDPELVEPTYGLALIAASRGELLEARRHLRRVLELDPELELARTSLAQVEARLATIGAEP